jgi:hypothetical protein
VPLMKRKSKKAFEHNIKAEMAAGKPQNQSLAIAYSVKRRAKKASGGTVESGSRDMNMADGGKVKSDFSGGQKRGPQGYPKYQEQAQNEKGVHTPVSGVTEFPGGKGTSKAGDYTKDRYGGKPTYEAGKDHPARKEHARVMAESKKIKPKLQGLAEGGEVNAKNARRPMPDNTYDDSKMVSRNKGNKSASHDSWTDNSTVTQAQSNNGRQVRPIKRPKMVPTDAFSTRLYDQEGKLQESASPGPYGEQPATWHDEEDAKKQGSSPDMSDEHSTHRKPYAKGGEVEAQDYDHKAKNKYEDDLLDLPPSEDEGDSMTMSHNEMEADMEGKGPDMEEPHNPDQTSAYAEGGEISPEDEIDEEHHNSITAAIMARRARLHAEIDSGAHDMDTAVRMAEGGRPGDEILSHDSIYSDDSDQADLSRNHDEDANEEDQLSFNALRKENYNTSNLDVDGNIDAGQHGDDEEMDSHDEHDMVSSIRSKMKARKQFR